MREETPTEYEVDKLYQVKKVADNLAGILGVGWAGFAFMLSQNALIGVAVGAALALLVRAPYARRYKAAKAYLDHLSSSSGASS